MVGPAEAVPHSEFRVRSRPAHERCEQYHNAVSNNDTAEKL